MFDAKRLDHAEAAIKGYLFYHGKDAQPLMYEMLIKCIESRKGLNGQTKEANEAEVRQSIGYAAHLAKKSRNPDDLMRVADMMVLRGYYGEVGEIGYRTNIGELVDLAADALPSSAYPAIMSVNLAIHDKDPKRMAIAADRLLSLGWPGSAVNPDLDDNLRRDVKEQVKRLAEALKGDGRTEEAEALVARLVESEARDIYIKLTWKGKADLDLSVAESLGATAKYQNRRTVFGGAIVKNGYGNHAEEVYVCPRGFNGPYTIVVEKIADYDPAKPVLEANLEIILHEGTAQEQRETHKVDMARPEPIVIKLTDGRRTAVLPFVAPPMAAEPKPKATPKETSKNANPPAAPRGAPIR